MRYSIMLQLVAIMTFILVATAALFAWVQGRNLPAQNLESRDGMRRSLTVMNSRDDGIEC